MNNIQSPKRKPISVGITAAWILFWATIFAAIIGAVALRMHNESPTVGQSATNSPGTVQVKTGNNSPVVAATATGQDSSAQSAGHDINIILLLRLDQKGNRTALQGNLSGFNLNRIKGDSCLKGNPWEIEFN